VLGDSGFPERDIFIPLVGDWIGLGLVNALREIMQGLEMIFKGLELSIFGLGFDLMTKD
jgi:hypothetical protein